MGHRLEELLESKIIRSTLLPLSFGFATGVRFRNFFYEKGLVHATHGALPVVSIGNIVAGGTGKTPLVHLLVQALIPNLRVAILTRGYKGSAEKRKEPLLAAEGAGPLYPPEVMGDEPYMLSKRLPEAIIVVGRERVKGVKLAQAAGAELIVLDDGMQYRPLFRDIEIAMVDGKDPFGGGYYLPRGFLRDEPRRLFQADFLVVRGENPFPQAPMPVVEVDLLAERVLTFAREPLSIAGAKVGLFCGIAKPERFVATIESLGAEVVLTHFVSDHAELSSEDLASFAQKAKERGATHLLCTEKDRVKMQSSSCALPLAYVEATLKLRTNEGAWEHLLTQIRALVKSYQTVGQP